jgi:hypothetical protein
MSVSTVKTGEAQGEFDPYAEWLSIGMDNRPITHYALMGFSQAEALKMFGRALTEAEKKRVEAAADRNMSFVRNYQTGSQSALSQRILNELARAKVILLDDNQKLRYDASLGRSISIGPHQGVRQALFETTGAQKVELGIEPPKTKRPQPRQVAPAPKATGNGSPVTPSAPAVPPAVVPTKAPPPVLEVLDHGPVVAPEQGWNFAGASDQSSIDAYKRKKQEPSWLQKNTAAVVATVGGIAVVGATGLYAIFGGGGKPAESEDNRPVLKKTDDDLVKHPPIRPLGVPTVEPEKPVIGTPVEGEKDPPQVAINVPEVKIDPEAEAKRLAEEQKKKEEEAQKKFDADVEQQFRSLQTRYANLPSSNLEQLGETEPDSVTKTALTRLVAERRAQEQSTAVFRGKVEEMFKTLSAPNSAYKDFEPAQIVAAAKGEKDPVTQTALFILAASRAGRAGNASELHNALNSINVAQFPRAQVISVEASLLAGNVNAPSKDITLEERLGMAGLATHDIMDEAIVLDDFKTANKLLAAAEEYMKGISTGSIRNPDDRMHYGEMQKNLRARIVARKQQLATFSTLHATHQSGLNLALEPKGPQEHVQTGIYLIIAKRDWKQALPHFQAGNDALLAKAAQMEAGKVTDAQGQYALAVAWKTAGDGKAAGEATPWYERAAHWLVLAEKQKPKGKLELDVALLRKELERSGVSLPTDAVQVAEVAVEKEMFPEGKWSENVLAKVDFEKLRVLRGTWQKAENGGVQNTTPIDKCRIGIPLEIKGDYDLRYVFTRTRGTDGVCIIIPIMDSTGNIRNTMLLISAGDGAVGGLEVIDGKRSDANPSTVKPSMIQNNAQYELVVSVRYGAVNRQPLVAIQSAINGKPYVGWQGNPDSLSMTPKWELPADAQVGLGSNNTNVTFHSLEVKRGAKTTVDLDQK